MISISGAKNDPALDLFDRLLMPAFAVDANQKIISLNTACIKLFDFKDYNPAGTSIGEFLTCGDGNCLNLDQEGPFSG